jgi:hypothetical protein
VRQTKKHGLLVAVAVVAVLVGSGPSDSANNDTKQRSGFFDRLFSTSKIKKTQPQPKPKTTFFNWFSPRKKVNVVYDSSFEPYGDVDPEPFPMKGMGNVDYVPPKPFSLFDPAATKTATFSSSTEAVRQVFLDRKSGYRINKTERDAIIAHYRARNYEAQWLRNGVPTQQANELLAVLAKSGENGLTPENYWTASQPASSQSQVTHLLQHASTLA